MRGPGLATSSAGLKWTFFKNPSYPFWIEGAFDGGRQMLPIPLSNRQTFGQTWKWMNQTSGERERECLARTFKVPILCSPRKHVPIRVASASARCWYNCLWRKARHRWPNKTGDDSMLAISLWRHQVYILLRFFFMIALSGERPQEITLMGS